MAIHPSILFLYSGLGRPIIKKMTSSGKFAYSFERFYDPAVFADRTGPYYNAATTFAQARTLFSKFCT
jgi:hypothetical protein